MKVEQLKYVKGLDVLRAFAVFFVIVQHWGPKQFSSPLLTTLWQTFLPDGLFGVDLFFVLSGYLITRILIQAKLENKLKTNGQIIKAFYIRRSLRIFPIYYLFIIVLLLLNAPHLQGNLGYYLTYTSNFLALKPGGIDNMDHTWSLAVEEQFYLIWPWIILFSPQKHLLKIIALSLLVGIVSSYLFYLTIGSAFYTITSSCLIAFSLGALFAHINGVPSYHKNFMRLLKISLLVAVPLFFINKMGHPIVLIRLVNAVIALSLIVYVVSEQYNLVTARIFRNRFLIHIGKISYGIYLYHYYLPNYYVRFVLYAGNYFNLNKEVILMLRNPPLGYLIQLLLLLTISYFSFHYFESAFTRLKNRFKYNEPQKLAMQNG